jgi:hypothetical protein
MVAINSDWVALSKYQINEILADKGLNFLFIKYNYFFNNKKSLGVFSLCFSFLTLLNHVLQLIKLQIGISCFAIRKCIHPVILRKYLENWVKYRKFKFIRNYFLYFHTWQIIIDIPEIWTRKVLTTLFFSIVTVILSLSCLRH